MLSESELASIRKHTRHLRICLETNASSREKALENIESINVDRCLGLEISSPNGHVRLAVYRRLVHVLLSMRQLRNTTLPTLEPLVLERGKKYTARMERSGFMSRPIPMNAILTVASSDTQSFVLTMNVPATTPKGIVHRLAEKRTHEEFSLTDLTLYQNGEQPIKSFFETLACLSFGDQSTNILTSLTIVDTGFYGRDDGAFERVDDFKIPSLKILRIRTNEDLVALLHHIYDQGKQMGSLNLITLEYSGMPDFDTFNITSEILTEIWGMSPLIEEVEFNSDRCLEQWAIGSDLTTMYTTPRRLNYRIGRSLTSTEVEDMLMYCHGLEEIEFDAPAHRSFFEKTMELRSPSLCEMYFEILEAYGNTSLKKLHMHTMEPRVQSTSGYEARADVLGIDEVMAVVTCAVGKLMDKAIGHGIFHTLKWTVYANKPRDEGLYEPEELLGILKKIAIDPWRDTAIDESVRPRRKATMFLFDDDQDKLQPRDHIMGKFQDDPSSFEFERIGGDTSHGQDAVWKVVKSASKPWPGQVDRLKKHSTSMYSRSSRK